MKVTIRDQKVLGRLSHEVVAKHLELTGWQQRKIGRNGALYVKRRGAPPAFEILLPTTNRLRDYAARMAEVLRTLEVVERRTQTEILADLTGTTRSREAESAGSAAEVGAAIVDLRRRIVELERALAELRASRERNLRESEARVERTEDLPPWEFLPKEIGEFVEGELEEDSRAAPSLKRRPAYARYERFEAIGRGGSGSVFRASDKLTGRPVAIKEISRVDTLHFRILRDQVNRLERARHPNIVHTIELDHDADKDSAFIAMEFVEGRTLAQRLSEGPLPMTTALGIARQIASALASAHRVRVLHLDLKPGNVMVSEDGRVKVLDFSSAALVGGGRQVGESTSMTWTKSGPMFGTVGYMSPERFGGAPPGVEADAWSFGCVLFECLTGRRLWEGASIYEVMHAITHEHPHVDGLPEATPESVRQLLLECLAKDPAERLRDMSRAESVLADALRSFGRPVPRSERARNVPPTHPESVSTQRRGSIAIVTPQPRLDEDDNPKPAFLIGGVETDEFEKALTVCVEDPSVRAIILNCENVAHLNSTSIGIIMRIHQMTHRSGRTMVLAHVAKHVESIFVITRLSMVLSVYPTVEAALEALSNEPEIR